MEDTPERLEKVVRTKRRRRAGRRAPGHSGLDDSRESTMTVLLDRGHLTTAYPEVVTSGGRGAAISLTYTEALHAPHADGKKGEKGNRNEVEGKVVTGLRDRFLPDGGRDRAFRTLWWRTFRYVEVAVKTADEPLTISDIRAAFSAYPLRAAREVRVQRSAAPPDPRRRLAHGAAVTRTRRTWTRRTGNSSSTSATRGSRRWCRCMPAGDDRLVRNAIELFDESRIPDGITQSRYPGALPQFIPPFSLFWIGMLHDHWWYAGDATFLKPYLKGARGVLDWFEARLAPSGLLGRMEWWNYADWVDSFPNGEPPMTRDGRVGDPHAAVRARAARGGGPRGRVRQRGASRAISCPRRQDGRRRRRIVLGREEGSARRHAGHARAGAST